MVHQLATTTARPKPPKKLSGSKDVGFFVQRPNERPNTRLLQEARKSSLRLQSHRAHLPEVIREETRYVQARQHGLLPRIRRILHPSRMQRHQPLPLLARSWHSSRLRGLDAGQEAALDGPPNSKPRKSRTSPPASRTSAPLPCCG